MPAATYVRRTSRMHENVNEIPASVVCLYTADSQTASRLLWGDRGAQKFLEIRQRHLGELHSALKFTKGIWLYMSCMAIGQLV